MTFEILDFAGSGYEEVEYVHGCCMYVFFAHFLKVSIQAARKLQELWSTSSWIPKEIQRDPNTN